MGITYIPFSFPDIGPTLKHVRCLFQTRVGGQCSGTYGGGNMSFATKETPTNTRRAILANRESLHGIVGYPMSELSQIHGDVLVFEPDAITARDLPRHEADGHATCRSGFALMIKTADCQPILIAHKNASHIMALHVGWRGNRMCFIEKAIKQFCAQYALYPKDLLAVRGPSLGVAEFVNFEKEWGDAFRPWFEEGTHMMDLWGLTRHQLASAGLLPQHIYGIDLCTATLNALFFSHRKEHLSGRQASVIWIEKD